MSTKLISRLLWLSLLVALPVPYWLFESGRVPTLWLGELTAFVLAMLLSGRHGHAPSSRRCSSGRRCSSSA